MDLPLENTWSLYFHAKNNGKNYSENTTKLIDIINLIESITEKKAKIEAEIKEKKERLKRKEKFKNQGLLEY